MPEFLTSGRVPSHPLDAITINEGKIAEWSCDNLYPAGQLDFCIDICSGITVEIRDDNKIHIEERFKPCKDLIFDVRYPPQIALIAEWVRPFI